MKKKYEFEIPDRGVLKKLMLMTRLTVLFVLALSLNVLGSAYSQNTKLNLDLEQTSIKKVLQTIEDQTDFRFIYENEKLNLDRKVNIQVTGQSVKEVLNRLFEDQNIDYAITPNNLIIVKPNEKMSNIGMAQSSMNVTGKVTDSMGLPLPGVTVVIKGTTNGTITDIDGNYSMDKVSSSATLVFSFVGMTSQEIPVQGKSLINVILKEDVIGIGEVVAIGYGTMKKSDLTGSIAQVKAEDLEKSSPSTVQDLLRSGIPGVISSLSNSAEGGGSLLVRGERSLAGGTSPLIVLDGVIHTGDLLEVNPKDIETIDVLKDASAAAVYGAKSANGVIIITTKKGKKGKPSIRFDSSIGFVTMGADREVYDADGYLQFRSDMFSSSNDYKNPAAYYKPTDDLLEKYGISIDEWRAYTNASSENDDATWLERIGLGDQEIENYFAGKTHNWYDESFQTGLKQDYNFSLSGANDKVNYYFSLGYLNSEGLIVGDKYENYRTNLKLDAEVTSFWDIGLTAKFTDRSSADLATNWGAQIIANTPYALPYDDDGNLNPYPMGETNTILGYNQAYKNKYQDVSSGNTSLNTSLWSKIKLPFNITYELRYSPRFSWYFYRKWNSSESVEDTDNGYVKRQSTKYFDWYIDNVIKWNYTFNDLHHFDVTLLHNAEEHQSWAESLVATDFTPSDALGWHYVSSAANQSISSTDTRSTGDALMARLFYSYDNRYMATLAVRRDGYSAFGPNNKRANFPSVALAWVFTNEKFFNWEAMSNGKLRLSWGVNGNRDIGIYQALSNLTTGWGKYVYADEQGSLTEVSQLYISRMANKDLRWEKTTSWNAGLDFGFLKNRLNGSIDYYHMPTTDLLMGRSLPALTGYYSITTNLGEVLNSGLELSINSVNIERKDLRWSTTFSFSSNKNEIKHLYYTYEDVLDESGNIIGVKEVDDSSNGWFIGKDINTIWDYKCIGIWQEGEEEEAALYGQQPGDAKGLDVNGDYSFTSNEDKVFLGQTTPKFRWSLRNDFALGKGLSISANIYSCWGHKSATTSYLHNSGADTERTNAYVEEYWTKENPSNRYARLNSTLPSNIKPKLVIDKSFIRLDNISLSYDLSPRIAKSISAQNIRLYGSVKNVAVWSKDWEYWDPEITGPVPRTFTLGATLTF